MRRDFPYTGKAGRVYMACGGSLHPVTEEEREPWETGSCSECGKRVAFYRPSRKAYPHLRKAS